MKATDRFLYTSLIDTDSGEVVPRVMTNITVRDHIAIEAIGGVILVLAECFKKSDDDFGSTDIAKNCYEIADAMIEESNK